MDSYVTELAAKLMERGFHGQKIEKNIDMINAILEIMVETDDEASRIYISEVNKYKELQRKYNYEYRQLVNKENDLREEMSKLDKEKYEVLDSRHKLEAQTELMNNELRNIMKAETPEGRDAYRRFLIFKDSATIDTVYDNTAFIKGAAQILAYPNGESSEEFEEEMDSIIESMVQKKITEKQKAKRKAI